MIIKITKAPIDTWYKNCLYKEFVVQSKSKKGEKGKYVVRLNKEDRNLMNGYFYGWVDMSDCEILED